MDDDQVEWIRINVTLLDGQSTLGLFVDETMLRWHPWWTDLRKFLLAFRDRETEVRELEGRTVSIELATLKGDSRRSLIEFLKTAPQEMQRASRSLNRALKILPMISYPVIVRYFLR